MGIIMSGLVYKAISGHGEGAEFFAIVWRNSVPLHVQFFRWLLVQSWIKCKVNLRQKCIMDDDTCAVRGTSSDTANNLIFTCPFSQGLWSAVGLAAHNAQANKHSLARLLASLQSLQPAARYNAFILLFCWKLWKHRNEVVFNTMAPSRRCLLVACKATAMAQL
jgi:hypothetical protein